MRAALERVKTVVCEPMCAFTLEIPYGALAKVLPVLGRLRATPSTTEARGEMCVLTGSIPAAHIHDLQQQLPSLTSGEGVLEYAFERYGT